MSDKKKEPLTILSSADAPVTGGCIDTKRPDFMCRRRLIKASAAAVPTIMTLRSGVAIAATSMDCRNKDAAVTDVPIITETAEDSWVRAQVTEYSSGTLVAYKGHKSVIEVVLEIYEDSLAFCSSETKAEDLAADGRVALSDLDVYTGPFLSVADEWYAQTSMDPSYQGLGVEGKHFIFCGDMGTGETRYALCYVTFDANGNMNVSKIAPDDPGDGQQVTESCACSVDPNFQIGPV